MGLGLFWGKCLNDLFTDFLCFYSLKMLWATSPGTMTGLYIYSRDVKYSIISLPRKGNFSLEEGFLGGFFYYIKWGLVCFGTSILMTFSNKM
jgi:hypothetical protein